MMVGKAKESLLTLLRELIRQVQAMDEAELSGIVDGTSKFELRVVRGKRGPSQKRRNLSDAELREIGEMLKAISSREEGNKLLSQKVSLKDDVSRLAKLLDVRVQKSDTGEHIKDRIIESTIGFRIRSAAVQGQKT